MLTDEGSERTGHRLTDAEALAVVRRLQSPDGMTMADMAAYGWDDDTWRAIIAGLRIAGKRMDFDRAQQRLRFL